MIILQRSVPEVYYNQSRDFQFLGRTLEVLANYLKTNADVIQAFPQSKNFDIHLLTLLAYTLGFNSKHNYNVDDLFTLCSCFNEILKYKGSLTAIRLSVKALLNSQQITESARVEQDESDKYNINIYLPVQTKDIILLEDLFDYILPAGFTYSFIYSSFGDVGTTDFVGSVEVKTKNYAQSDVGKIATHESERFDFDNPQNELQQTSTGVIVGPQED